MTECPTCGETYASERAVGIHHSQVHGESLARETYTCDYCGDKFEKQVTKVTGENTYCSENCKDKDKRIGIGKGRLYGLYWGDKLTAYEVADELEVSQNTVRRRLSDYGIPLVAESRNHDAWLFKQRPAKWYKKEYHNKRKSTYTIARENNVSQEWVRKVLKSNGIKLRNEWIEHKKSDEVLEHTEYDYGPEWQEVRQEVIERDNHTCQGCGTHESELDNALQVHHIRALREISDVSKANQHTNLVSLCVNCHNRWENVPLRPEFTG